MTPTVLSMTLEGQYLAISLQNTARMIALKEYVSKIYLDVQNGALGVENDSFRNPGICDTQKSSGIVALIYAVASCLRKPPGLGTPDEVVEKTLVINTFFTNTLPFFSFAKPAPSSLFL